MMEQLKQYPFSSIAGALRYQAQVKPNKIAIRYPDSAKAYSEYAELTYKQYDNVTNHLALKTVEYLKEKLSSTHTVTCAILAMGGFQYLLSQYALLKLNNVILFSISARNSQAAIEHLLRETNTVLLFTTKQYLPMINAIQNQDEFRSMIVLLLDSEEFQLENLLNFKDQTCEWNDYQQLVSIKQRDEQEINRTIMILHSSGSTAFPKPIYLSNRYFLMSSLQYHSVNKDFWREDDISLSWCALFHMMAFSGTTRAVIQGCTYSLPLSANFPPNPDELVRNIDEKHGVTVLVTVPSLLEQLIRELMSEKYRHIGFAPLKKLRFIMYGGAGCPDELCKLLVDNGIVLTSAYGATETGPILMKNMYPYDGRWKVMQLADIRKPYIRIETPENSQNPNEKIIMHLPNDPFLADNMIFLENGCYTVGDVVLEDPPNSGQYLILGRQDDILVHVNGEKTNPLPMEDTIRQSPVIQAVALVGHNQFSPAALIQLDVESASKYTPEEIDDLVWQAVQQANKQAPSHSTILRKLVYILSADQILPVTIKGNLMRRKVNQQYASLISKIYDQFFSDKQNHVQQTSSKQWTLETIKTYLKEKFGSIIDVSDSSKSVFDIGINSLQTLEMRNWICQEICEIPKNFIYEHSSIDRMSKALIQCLECVSNSIDINSTSTDRFHYEMTEDILEKFISLMKDQPLPKIEKEAAQSNGRIFLVTGANGSLGNFLVRDLLRRSVDEVAAVYCLLRGSNTKERLFESFKQRQLDVSFLEKHLNQRLFILPSSMNLNDPHLGQSEDIFQHIQDSLTDIIHCAWKINFNQTIRDFEEDTLFGHYQLLKLAMSNRKQFHFISSIASASSGLLANVKEEALPRNAHVALSQGYGQSKYIGEHLAWAAMNIWKVSANVYRVGQISGDRENGVWNTTELAPMMIYAGAGLLKKMPNIGRDICWIPVDICSYAIVDLAIRSSFDASTSIDERVHHLINPHQISYKDYLEYLKNANLQFDTVTPQEFLDLISSEANTMNPLAKLSSFLEQAFQKKPGTSSCHFETSKTQARCETICNCPPVDKQWIQLYVDYWRRSGLID